MVSVCLCLLLPSWVWSAFVPPCARCRWYRSGGYRQRNPWTRNSMSFSGLTCEVLLEACPQYLRHRCVFVDSYEQTMTRLSSAQGQHKTKRQDRRPRRKPSNRPWNLCPESGTMGCCGSRHRLDCAERRWFFGETWQYLKWPTTIDGRRC